MLTLYHFRFKIFSEMVDERYEYSQTVCENWSVGTDRVLEDTITKVVLDYVFEFFS